VSTKAARFQESANSDMDALMEALHPGDEPLPGNGTYQATPPTARVGPQSPAELAMDNRRWYGSEEAGRNLNPSNPAAGRAAIERLAPGPSRTPMRAELRGMDQRFQDLISDEGGYVSPYMALRAYQLLNKNVPGFKGVPAAAGRGVGILGAASAIAQLGTTKP
jgi:hypothetical protein